jgi:hypothetical protein
MQMNQNARRSAEFRPAIEREIGDLQGVRLAGDLDESLVAMLSAAAGSFEHAGFFVDAAQGQFLGVADDQPLRKQMLAFRDGHHATARLNGFIDPLLDGRWFSRRERAREKGGKQQQMKTHASNSPPGADFLR